MIPLTDDQLRAVEETAEQATPGPWRAAVTPHPSAISGKKEAASVYGPDCLIYTAGRDYSCLPDTWERQRADAAHIAACDPQTVVALVAEVRRLRETGRAMLTKLSAMEKPVNACIVISDTHGCPYTGPSWAMEWNALDAALPRSGAPDAQE